MLQALTDSVLLKISHTGRNFRGYTVHGDGSSITVEPGLIGGEVNRILAAHQAKNKLPVQYKIGPDPSSIDSCMVGGAGLWLGVVPGCTVVLAGLRAACSVVLSAPILPAALNHTHKHNRADVAATRHPPH